MFTRTLRRRSIAQQLFCIVCVLPRAMRATQIHLVMCAATFLTSNVTNAFNVRQFRYCISDSKSDFFFFYFMTHPRFPFSFKCKFIVNLVIMYNRVVIKYFIMHISTDERSLGEHIKIKLLGQNWSVYFLAEFKIVKMC